MHTLPLHGGLVVQEPMAGKIPHKVDVAVCKCGITEVYFIMS